MRVHPLRVEQAALYVHFTYSLCFHAAALALLVALPVVGISGMPPGGGYVVALTDKVEQPPKGGALKKTNVRPAVAGVNSVGDKPKPVPKPSSVAGLSAKAPQLTAKVKPLLAQVHSGPLQMSNAGGANKTDSLHQAKREPLAKSVTPETVKPTQSAARPMKEEPSVRPDVPEVLTDRKPESVAAMPRRETTLPDADSNIAPSKDTVKTQEKSDAGHSPDANGISAATRGKDPVSQSNPAGKPAVTSSAQKDGRAGNGDSETGSLTSGGATSSKTGVSGGSAKSGGQSVDGGGEDAGTRNKVGTSPEPGKGYKLTAVSLPREFGLFRGTGRVFGEATLGRREARSDRDMPDKGKKGTEETLPMAIRVPEALLVREIKIEVVGDKKALSNILMGLTIKAHPANRRKHVRDAERKIEEAEIALSGEDSSASAIKTLSLRKAEKGVYMFSLNNVGKATSVSVVFHLYAQSEQGRMKEYKSVPLPPLAVAKFMFLMPEVLFWGDTDRFSGIIEDSHSVTKFRYETGLIWKEEKE